MTTQRTITLTADQWDVILEAVECYCEEGPPRLSAASTALSSALEQPEPEGLTDEPLGDLIDKWVQEAFRKKPYGCKHPTHTYVACKAFEHGRNHAARTALDQPEPEELSHETAARNAVEFCLAQREEVLEAFIAKHGFCPDEAIQIEQRLEDGSSTWRIERRTALTQPKPEGPTDEEIMQLMPQQMHEDLAAAARALAEQASTISTSATGIMRIMLNRHAVDLARAVLARWSRPAIKPVPVSERSWEREGWCDGDGWCWCFDADGTDPCWSFNKPEGCPTWTHLLPHDALPLPVPTQHS
jgi:hypothetical protein